MVCSQFKANITICRSLEVGTWNVRDVFRFGFYQAYTAHDTSGSALLEYNRRWWCWWVNVVRMTV